MTRFEILEFWIQGTLATARRSDQTFRPKILFRLPVTSLSTTSSQWLTGYEGKYNRKTCSFRPPSRIFNQLLYTDGAPHATGFITAGKNCDRNPAFCRIHGSAYSLPTLTGCACAMADCVMLLSNNVVIILELFTERNSEMGWRRFWESSAEEWLHTGETTWMFQDHPFCV